MKESFAKPQVTIRDYLFILFHRKKYFLLPALIVFFTASIGSFFLPKYYSASVIVFVQEEKVINPLAPKPTYVATAPVNLVEQLKTLTEQILNYPQLIMVIKDLGLDKNITSPLEMEKLIFTIRKKTDVGLRSPDVFEVSYEDKDPKRAQELVNTLLKNFINFNAKKREDLALMGAKFAESQAAIYQKKLEESENAFYEYKKKFPLQTPGKDTDINVSLLINYQTALTNVELALKETEEGLSRIKKQLSGRSPVPMSEELLKSQPIIESLNQQLKNAQLQLDDLMQQDPGSDKILDLELIIDDLRRRLAEETEKMVDMQTPQTAPFLYRQLEERYYELTNTVEDLRRREKQFKVLVDEYEHRIETLPEQDRIYANLLRDNRVNSNIYEMLRLKVEENRLDAIELQQKGTRYEIIEEARLPLKPSKPQKLLISIVAMFLGILAGLGCVFLVEMSDHSFRNVEDARKFLDIPVIGSTMKMLTQKEVNESIRNRRWLTFILVLIFLVFIIVAVTFSYFQEKQLTERIIKEQIEAQK